MKRLFQRRFCDDEILIQFLKFGIVGACGFVLDCAFVYSGIYLFGISRTAAGLISFFPVVTFTWFGNRVFTFRDAPRGDMHKQWARFAVACAIGLAFNRGTYVLLINNSQLVFDYPVLGLLAGTGAGMFFNFFTSKKLVFR